MPQDFVVMNSGLDSPLITRFDGFDVNTIKSQGAAPINAHDLTQDRDGNLYASFNFFGSGVVRFNDPSDFGAGFTTVAYPTVGSGFGLTSLNPSQGFWMSENDGMVRSFNQSFVRDPGGDFQRAGVASGATSITYTEGGIFSNVEGSYDDDIYKKHSAPLGVLQDSIDLGFVSCDGIDYNPTLDLYAIVFTFLGVRFVRVLSDLFGTPTLVHQFSSSADANIDVTAVAACILDYQAVPDIEGKILFHAESEESIATVAKSQSPIKHEAKSKASISMGVKSK